MNNKKQNDFLLVLSLEFILLISIILIRFPLDVDMCIIVSIVTILYLIFLIIYLLTNCKDDGLSEDLINLIICKSNVNLDKNKKIVIKKEDKSYIIEVITKD